MYIFTLYLMAGLVFSLIINIILDEIDEKLNIFNILYLIIAWPIQLILILYYMFFDD